MGWYATGGTFNNGSVTIQFGGYAPPVETCFRCTKNAHIMYHDQNGNPWCKPCGDEQMRAQQAAAEQARRHAIAARAYEWVGAACWSAAIGSLLNIGFEAPPFVPDAYRRHGEMAVCEGRADVATRAWLAEAGYDLVDLGPHPSDFEAGEVTLNMIRERNADLDWVLMVGNSPRMHKGVPIVHVVCCNLTTLEIWDPHPSQSGLIDWFQLMAIRPVDGEVDDA